MTISNQYVQTPPSVLVRLLKWVVSLLAVILLLYLVWSLCGVGCELFNFNPGHA